MTKHEGPAQEPPITMHRHLVKGERCDICDNKPATPAPSQPAGAREWLSQRYLPSHCGLFGFAEVALLIEQFAAQQTAAKDAKAETFRCQLRDALQLRTNVMWFGAGLLTAAGAVVERAEAAERERDSYLQQIAISTEATKRERVELNEAWQSQYDAMKRERDSLRELLKRLNRRGGLGLDVHEEIDAALKAGRDGQQ